MARLFADENFPHPAVEALRALGHDVVTVQDVGLGGNAVSDDEILQRATRDGRAVLTLNRKDFIALHRIRPGHAGIIVCTFDLDFTGQAQRIDAAVRGRNLEGQEIRVNRPG
jgi:hypothetical protein